MKKTLLLLFASAITMIAAAQQPEADNNTHSRKNINISAFQKKMAARSRVGVGTAGAAEKTTTPVGGVRWYDFGVALNAWEVNYNSLTTSGYAQPVSPWVDTFSYITYPTAPTMAYITMASVGIVLAPQDTLFNDYHSYLGFGYIKVSASDAYTVDSFALLGIYGHAYTTPANAGSVDTIRMTFTYGGAGGSGGIIAGGISGSSPGGYASVTFLTLPYDSITNISQSSYTVPPSNVQDIILDNRASGGNGIYSPNGTAIPQQLFPAGTPAYYDTTDAASPLGSDILGADGGIAVKLNTPLHVPAGQFAGVSLTFFSGMPAPPAPTGPLTGGAELAAIDASGNEIFYYNDFQPIVNFASDGGSPPVAQFVPYSLGVPAGLSNNPYIGSATNNNTGCFKMIPNSKNGWTDQYLPNWSFYTAAGAAATPSENQYPFIDLHIACTTCDTIRARPHFHEPFGVSNVNNNNNTVNAYPNPASNELYVVFNLTQASAVSVTLTNITGEMVATQDMGVVATGKAVLHTASLPEGIYIYTLNTNGVHTSTGHIAIIH